MSLLGDIAGLTGNDSFNNFANSGLGQILNTSLTNTVNKAINPTPKPTSVPTPVVQTSSPVSVSNIDQGLIKKVLIGAGLLITGLMAVYLFKKGRR